jgi:hypothetical protein
MSSKPNRIFAVARACLGQVSGHLDTMSHSYSKRGWTQLEDLLGLERNSKFDRVEASVCCGRPETCKRMIGRAVTY